MRLDKFVFPLFLFVLYRWVYLLAADSYSRRRFQFFRSHHVQTNLGPLNLLFTSV